MRVVAWKTGTTIYAWALMTNHAHILLKSGQPGLSALMRKFLIGFLFGIGSVSVYQNRYRFLPDVT